MPATIARAETVGVPVARRINLRLKHGLHIICHRFHNLAAHAVHGIGLEHVIPTLHGIGPLEITGTDSCHERCITLCPAQLAADNLACIKGHGAVLPYQGELIGLRIHCAVQNHVLELGAQELGRLAQQILGGTDSLTVRLTVLIPHKGIDFPQRDVQSVHINLLPTHCCYFDSLNKNLRKSA